MRLISIILTLVLIAAVIIPMYLKGPGGRPIMAAEDWAPETLKPATPVYKWRDEFGAWQFGEEPPAAVEAVLVEIDTDAVTPMGKEWNVAKPDDENALSALNAGNPASLINAAKDAIGRMDARTQQTADQIGGDR